MIRRNLTTTFMVVGAALLLFGGVALAREAQTGESHRPQLVATMRPTATDDGAGPTASPDDHGGKGGDDGAKPTSRPTAKPTASPDDDGGHGGDDSASPTPSPDDNGGHGGDGN